MSEDKKPMEIIPSHEVAGDRNVIAEKFIAEVIKDAGDLHAVDFATESEAVEAFNTFISRHNETLNDVDGLAGIAFEVSGPGVTTPDMSVHHANAENKEMAIAVTLDSPEYRSLELFEAAAARFHSIVCYTEYDDQRGAHVVNVNLVMAGAEPHEENMTMYNGIPIAKVLVVPFYVVECSDRSTIGIPELNEKRAQAALADELAKNSLTAGIFNRKLDELRVAFTDDDPRHFHELTGISAFHDLGKISNERARRGVVHADLMSRAILGAIGKDRFLEVEGTPIGHENAATSTISTGRVVDVLMPDSEAHDINPTLVLEVPVSETDTEIYRYPFERVHSIRF